MRNSFSSAGISSSSRPADSDGCSGKKWVDQEARVLLAAFRLCELGDAVNQLRFVVAAALAGAVEEHDQRVFLFGVIGLGLHQAVEQGLARLALERLLFQLLFPVAAR